MDEKLNPIYDVINPNRNVPPHEALVKRIQEVQAANLARQQGQIGDTQAQISALEGKKQSPDYSAIMAMTDAVTGNTNMSGLYNQIKGKDTTPAQLQQLRGILGKQQGAVGDTELKALQMQAQLYSDAERNKVLEKMNQGKVAEKAQEIKLTPGQESLDKKFATEYSDWVGAGGYANVANNLDKLKGSSKRLEGDDEMGRKFAPQGLRKLWDPESVGLEQDIESVTFQSLKQILGGSFTEKEAKRLISTNYDAGLSDVQNQKKLNNLIGGIQKMADSKQKAMEYFEKNGTLKGYQGDQSMTLDKLNSDLKKQVDSLGSQDKKPAVQLGEKGQQLAKELGL